MKERNKNPEKGLSYTFDRRNKFFIRRYKNMLGLEYYHIENKGVNQKIDVERVHFDRLRATLQRILIAKKIPSEMRLRFNDKDKLFLAINTQGEGRVLIRVLEGKLDEKEQSVHFSLKALPALLKLLYADDLGHPNDALDLLCMYHSLFQFSFVEGSESITSDLTLRKDVLSQVDIYRPKTKGGAVTTKKDSIRKNGEKPEASKGGGPKEFKPRLGEKDKNNRLKVDYEALFNSKVGIADKTPKAGDNDRGSKLTGATKTTFPLPIAASEVKSYTGGHFVCHFSQEEIQEFRQLFLKDRSSDFFLGIEIIDAIFKKQSGLRTFRFPLYYMKVNIEESGRDLYIYPDPNGAVYLNHLALANLIESFAPFESGPGGPVGAFFRTLGAQTMKVGGYDDRIRLTRKFPVQEEVFERTRELLLGYKGENGRGGLLGHLKLVGMEADLDASYLYKSLKNDAPLVAALSSDLEFIRTFAHRSPSRFYNSLLGQFLTPEKRQAKTTPFSQILAMPGVQPKSIRNLVDKLNKHDLVLLEGPPGTGKTFSILNLFIHSLITGKRLLVVSDKESAVHALTEKVSEFLLGKDRGSTNSQHLNQLLNSAVKVVDKAPLSDNKLSEWVRDLKEMLHIYDPKIQEWPKMAADTKNQLEQCDKQIAVYEGFIAKTLETRLGADAAYKNKVAPKRLHATTVNDIKELMDFLGFVASDSRVESGLFLFSRYIKDREFLLQDTYKEIYSFFKIPSDLEAYGEKIALHIKYLNALIKNKPRSIAGYEALFAQNIIGTPVLAFFHKKYLERFSLKSFALKRIFNQFISFFHHSIVKQAKDLRKILIHQSKIITIVQNEAPGILSQLNTIHDSLSMPKEEEVPLCLEICRFAIETRLYSQKVNAEGVKNPSVQECLVDIEKIMKKRDEIIKKAFVGRLGDIARLSYAASEDGGTTKVTSIGALLDNLKTFSSIDAATDVLKELQRQLISAFPVWVCCKQAVSFLFPCKENLFDLVIVDEATQCRVDDALPILYRAKKLMVVGDEKQTVLARNSVIDDYLFNEHDLKEHLVNSQAIGIKGGGSHIFGLIKGIKQASVMLDEHYRCPPDIIGFSNHYVYHDELKTMQWTMKNARPSVVVDYSEKEALVAERRGSGKYKGLETGMIDRFLDYVARTIKEIEAETGKKINTDTDVALCYFLLKNEPYFKDVKGKFLQNMGRGSDILDGAGAALQGKERDYIFYLWDINRGNMGAFRQGDDPDKRKGELNVLMSRPKVRAYHYIHKYFDRLDHRTASIVDYLWKTYNLQGTKSGDKKQVVRVTRPPPDFVPWSRSSGPLMEAMLSKILVVDGVKTAARLSDKFTVQTGVVVGDPRHKVDVVYSKKTKKSQGRAVGVIDLSDFDSARDVVDYYFQCLRAKPGIDPFFVFLHELATPETRVFRSLKMALGMGKKPQKKAS